MICEISVGQRASAVAKQADGLADRKIDSRSTKKRSQMCLSDSSKSRPGRLWRTLNSNLRRKCIRRYQDECDNHGAIKRSPEKATSQNHSGLYSPINFCRKE
ncbi:hypothetical protein PoB_007482200 [Plakobranchus ocellatus]|uniref:Uncharacterized protein n=1 Tax=Plakobranchus ocellatus TaxID=259542 RepID=A0AAV4DVJ4_9GAST|nr:hypothetical protein PoB_007482200 [Plakobranchus ocellatus]